MSNKGKKRIGCLLILFFAGYLFKELFGASACGMSFNDSSPTGSSFAGLFARRQAIYWLEKEQFASSQEIKKELVTEELSTFTKIKDYKYLIEVFDKAAFNQIFATVSDRDLCAKQYAPLITLVFDSIFGQNKIPTYTLISAIFGFPNAEYKQIICISDTPGYKQLNKPY